jgi:hypothetical protein
MTLEARRRPPRAAILCGCQIVRCARRESVTSRFCQLGARGARVAHRRQVRAYMSRLCDNSASPATDGEGARMTWGVQKVEQPQIHADQRRCCDMICVYLLASAVSRWRWSSFVPSHHSSRQALRGNYGLRSGEIAKSRGKKPKQAVTLQQFVRLNIAHLRAGAFSEKLRVGC